VASISDKLLSLDRRWLFLLVFLGVAIPIIRPVGLPVTTTASTRMAYEYVERLEPGDVVWLSFDYGPPRRRRTIRWPRRSCGTASRKSSG